MLKKTIVFVTIAVLLIGCMVFPASAAVPDWAIDWNDYVTDLEIDSNTGIVTVSLPRDLFLIKVSGTVHDNYFYWGENGILKNVYLESGYSYNITFYSDPNKPIYVGNIPDGSRISVSASISDNSKMSYDTPYCYWLYKSYDENNKWIMDTTARQSLTDGDIVSDKYPIQSVTVDGLFVKEQGARTAYAAVFGVEFNSLIPWDFGYWSFQMDSLEISFPVSSLAADKIMNQQNQKLLNKISSELESQGQTLESVLQQQQQTNDKLDQLPGQIGDEMQGVIDQEKQEAADVGDSSAGELIDIIPNHSEGFISAIEGLVSSMSYNGTNATLTIPPITLPEIPGVMSEMPLTGEMQADFGYWFDKIPSDIMDLVRILCTIALIVYCFKELYSTISYALTLKGGGSDE